MSARAYAPGAVLDEVAVFPLPQVVLFPGAIMPLHVFEPRYRSMTRDVLASTRRLCVAQIPEDHGIDAHGQPDISSVAGVGEIVRCDALPDGRFNILVEGIARVSLEELPFRRPYRRSRLIVLGSGEGDLDPALLRALISTATKVAGAIRECHPAFRFSLPEAAGAGPVVDACAHHLVLGGTERQALLETLDVAERVERCLEMLVTQQSLFGDDGETLH
jgi:ATP-dependent Lon protease